MVDVAVACVAYDAGDMMVECVVAAVIEAVFINVADVRVGAVVTSYVHVSVAVGVDVDVRADVDAYGYTDGGSVVDGRADVAEYVVMDACVDVTGTCVSGVAAMFVVGVHVGAGVDVKVADGILGIGVASVVVASVVVSNYGVYVGVAVGVYIVVAGV